jgi:hypothetical protein
LEQPVTISITSPITLTRLDLPFPTPATLHEWQKEPEHVRTSQHGTPVIVLLRGEGLNDTSLYTYAAPNVVQLYVGNGWGAHGSWSPPFMSWLNEQMNTHPDRVHPKLREAWQRAVADGGLGHMQFQQLRNDMAGRSEVSHEVKNKKLTLDLTLPTTFAEFSEWNTPGWDMFKSDPFKSSDGVPLVLGVTAAGGGTVLWYSSGTSVLLVGPRRVGPAQWNDKEFLQWLEKAMGEYPSAVHPKLREAWHRAVLHQKDEIVSARRLKTQPCPCGDDPCNVQNHRVDEKLAEYKKLGDEGAQIRKDFEKTDVGIYGVPPRVKPFSIDEVVSAAAATGPGNIFQWETMPGSAEAHIGKPCSCGADPCPLTWKGVATTEKIHTVSVRTEEPDPVKPLSPSASSALDLVAKKILVTEAEKVLASVKTEIGPKEHVRVVRAVVFEGTYEAVQKQIKASLPVGERGNVHSSSACKITIAQGEIERVLPPSTPVEGY